MDTERKKLILSKIHKAILKEEEAIPVYKKHLDSASFFGGFPPELYDEIKKRLKVISKDCDRHKYLLQEIASLINSKG